MFVFSNEVRTEENVTVGTFSSHGAAMTAMTRITRPEWKSLFPELERDKQEERRMSVRITAIG
jgi:hypothetical protein